MYLSCCIYLDVFVFVLLLHPKMITSPVVLLLQLNLKFQMITKFLEKPCGSDCPLLRKKIILFYALSMIGHSGDFGNERHLVT